MRILVTGRGGAASWTIRGEQIGAALGATVKPNASRADVVAHDVVLVVKRIPDTLLHVLHTAGVPWVYDMVDAYPQRQGALWNLREATSWVDALLRHLKPHAVIWPNQTMSNDCGFIASEIGADQAVIYHHHRPHIEQNPIREKIQTIGYEGSLRYIEKLLPWIERECGFRGWRFVQDAPRLADLDLVLALRGGIWDSVMCRRWKSNVKLANAQGSGTPFIGAPEYGYIETEAGGEKWASSRAEIAAAFDALVPYAVRYSIAQNFRRCARPIEKAAAETLEILIRAAARR